MRAREGAKADERWLGRCLVGLPEFRAGRVAVVFGTLFAPRAQDLKDSSDIAGLAYANDEEAESIALSQIEFYRQLARGRRLPARRNASRPRGNARRLVRRRPGRRRHRPAHGGSGPDPPARGRARTGSSAASGSSGSRGGHALRWRDGGAGAAHAGRPPARGRCRQGRDDRRPLARRGGLVLPGDLLEGPAIASHSNPRAICPGDRQLADPMIRAIAAQDGVMGVVPFNRMPVEGW
jgi:membrane dipeptidase